MLIAAVSVLAAAYLLFGEAGDLATAERETLSPGDPDAGANWGPVGPGASLPVGLSSTDASSGTLGLIWTRRSDMPTPRQWLGVAAASDGKVYAIGGYAPYGNSAVVEEYDPATDTWRARASMGLPRSDLGVVAAPNGKIYAIGGCCFGTPSSSSHNLGAVEEYDPTTDTWVYRARMPTERTGLAVAHANGKIYAMGGRGSEGYLATVEEYDPASNTWTTRASLPAPRAGLAGASVNGKVYAVGGVEYGTLAPSAILWEYDPTTDTWSSRSSMHTARAGLAAVAMATARSTRWGA